MMKKILSYFACAAIMFSFAACNKGGNEPEQQEEYVDLGLPSGTLWKTSNEVNPDDEHGFYSYDEAMSAFGLQVPSVAQWNELINNCTWQVKGNGYEVSGNGKKIFLPAEGNVDKFGSFETGIWYFAKDHPSNSISCMTFQGSEPLTGTIDYGSSVRMSVRLVR